MSFPWAVTTLTDRFRAGWAETDVILDGDAYDEPNPPRPFVILGVEGGPSESLGIAGDGVLYCRQHLTVTLDAFSPITDGRALPVELADRAGLVLARLSLGGTGPRAPGLTTLVPSTSGPWPARGSAGYLTARCEIEGHVDFWSERNAG